ncbi:MAG: DUF1049 domain-containing protein [Acidobacteria bacterium]|nr:DUF1049 domain-containing protein [Acidobacteriota bacterium]
MDEINDTDGQLEAPQPEEPPADIPWGGIVATVGLILVVVFAVQNTETVAIEFLWMSGTSPLSIVILVSAVASAVFTTLGGVFYRRRRHRRRAEKDELEHLRGDD